MSKKNNLLVAASGTGGHIFPALAVSREIEDEWNIHWLGVHQRLLLIYAMLVLFFLRTYLQIYLLALVPPYLYGCLLFSTCPKFNAIIKPCQVTLHSLVLSLLFLF